MKNSRKIIILGVFVIALMLSSCTSNESVQTSDKDQTSSTTIEQSNESDQANKQFTLEELAMYTGKDGMPAYIAVNGIVYDVSDIKVWENGDHNGFQAGQDLTEFFPHDQDRLDYGEIVGTLILTEQEDNDPEDTSDTENTSDSGEATDIDSDVSETQDQSDTEMTKESEADTDDDDKMDDSINESTDTSSDTDETSSDNDENSSDSDESTTAENTTEETMNDSDTNNEPALPTFTEDELALYNGENDMPIYIAFEGIVYDVSHLSGWSDGMHNGIAAGYDLTDDIGYAPHGDEKLEKAIVVGTLIK